MRKFTALPALVLALSLMNMGVASDRPYKDTGSADLDLATLSIVGTRIATHLGQSTWEASEIMIDLSQLGDGIVGVSYVDTITAANGDTLITDAVAELNINDIDNVLFSAVETVTGGTGRFTGASGSFDVTGTVLLDAQAGAGLIVIASSGSIGY